jgi:hypothetical protein
MIRIASASPLLLNVYATIKHAAARRAPKPQESRLRRRVLQVWAVERVGIEEDGHGVVERDVVLRRVGLSLSRVPLEH